MGKKKTFSLNRKCKHCGCDIPDKSKSGYCGKCYMKYGCLGENNSFYGKKHTKEVIETLKEKCAEASKKKWEDPVYRKHVLDAVVGLKRSEKFKHEQSERAKNQMNDPNQRKIRSISMKKNWQDGKMCHCIIHSSISKQQKDFFERLKKYYEIDIKHIVTYINENTNRKKWLIPDAYIKELNLIIEYNGSFWHADKRRYKADDIMHHGITAKEIWEKDKKRINIFKQHGYNYIEVWSLDYWESCSSYDDKENFVKQFVNEIKYKFS